MYPSLHVVQLDELPEEQLEQERSHIWHVEVVLSKYESLGQYSIHLPFERTGREAGQVRQEEDEKGDEHVEQSGKQGSQVPLTGTVLPGQEIWQVPRMANNGTGHLLHVSEVEIHSVHEGSQAKMISSTCDDRTHLDMYH
jgi:hypothetical protein